MLYSSFLYCFNFCINCFLYCIHTLILYSFFRKFILLFLLQRLYSLPERLANRFKLYLNVLPLVQTSAIYICFIFGLLFLTMAVYKYTKPDRSFNGKWPETDGQEGKVFLEDIEEDRSSIYICREKSKVTEKELESYISSLVAPVQEESLNGNKS